MKNICPYWKDHYEITILALSSEVRAVESEAIDDSLTVTRVPYSWVSRYFSNRRYSDRRLTGLTLKLSRIISYLMKRYYLFPDPWVIEQKCLSEALAILPRPPDLLVASMMPFSMADVLYNYRSENKDSSSVPVVLDIGDPLAHNVAKGIVANQSKLLQYESRILQGCDHIIVTNCATANHYAHTYQIDPALISVIPQGALAPDWVSEKPSLHIKTVIDLRYAGLFIKNIRDPRLLFSLLKQSVDSIELTVCGGIDQCFIAGNGHIKFEGWIGDAEVSDFYKDADCLLYFDNKRGLQTSGKIYELLATRKPLLFCYDNEDSPVKKECEKYGHIIFVKNEQKEIEAAIENLESSIYAALKWLTSKAGQSFSSDEFAWHERSARFRVIFDKFLKENHR